MLSEYRQVALLRQPRPHRSKDSPAPATITVTEQPLEQGVFRGRKRRLDGDQIHAALAPLLLDTPNY